MSMAIMDSSPQPVVLRRPLKRSASTASLPTPPRSSDKRVARRIASAANSSDGEDDSDSDVERYKTAKTGTSLRFPDRSHCATTDGDNPFWAPAAGLQALSERLANTAVAPMSPPRSKRQTQSRPKQAEDASCLPVRDSPNNPFLVSSPVKAPTYATPPQDVSEKPTIAYVFRGVKTEFANPLYELSPSAREASKLPMEHPDFSPDPVVAPRMLFPAHRQSDTDEEDFAEDIKPKRLVFSHKSQDDAETGGRPGLGRTTSEVHRMALGPKRGAGGR